MSTAAAAARTLCRAMTLLPHAPLSSQLRPMSTAVLGASDEMRETLRIVRNLRVSRTRRMLGAIAAVVAMHPGARSITISSASAAAAENTADAAAENTTSRANAPSSTEAANASPARGAITGIFQPSDPAARNANHRMHVVESVADLRAARAALLRLEGGDTDTAGQLGFVPTMGCLHEGHIALVRQAKAECGRAAVSIFVNPAQFAPTEDLDRYPRTLQRDLDMCHAAGADIVFVPAVRDMYPAGIVLNTAEQVGTFVEVRGRSHQMEGAIRPHFFRGVATVVIKLLNAVAPTKAFFGQKDAQQCVVVRQMVRDLLLPIDIVVGNTVREPDGLAMSSRNRYLSPAERAVAPVLYRALMEGMRLFETGVTDRAAIVAAAEAVVRSAEPDVTLQYLSLADAEQLQEVQQVDLVAHPHGVIFSGAVKIGNTRIIDNLWLGLRTHP